MLCLHVEIYEREQECWWNVKKKSDVLLMSHDGQVRAVSSLFVPNRTRQFHLNKSFEMLYKSKKNFQHEIPIENTRTFFIPWF